jgi:hypothetical protein
LRFPAFEKAQFVTECGIAHLAITIRIFPFAQSFSVCPESISSFLQEATNRIITNGIALTLEFSADRARGFLCPF